MRAHSPNPNRFCQCVNAATASPAQQVTAARQFYAQANDSKHPIRNILIRIPVDSPDLLAVIQREGAV